MNLGKTEEGHQLLSHQRIVTYGAGGLSLWEGQEVGGCPAQYRARYEDGKVQMFERSAHMAYGSTIHSALHAMEEEAIGPEEALERVWAPELPMERMREAKNDLEKYLSRGGPMAIFGTLAVELNLHALLYEDEDFGPVHYGGYVDWLGVDVQNPATLHLVDYKSGWAIPSREDVMGNVQLMGYDYLVRKNWRRLGMSGRPDVVCHIDAIKWRDVEVKFSDHQIEDWRDWAAAIARKILRDDDAKPVLNPGCGWCPIKLDCKQFRRLPGLGSGLMEKRAVAHLDQLVKWREEAKMTIKHLKAAIEEIDAAVEERVALEGEFVAGPVRYFADTAWEDSLDRLSLLGVIGEREYALLAAPSKKALDRWLEGRSEEVRAAVKACYERVPRGRRIKAQKLDA